MQGYTNGGTKKGQNDCIFGAVKEERMSFKIVKKSDDGLPLKGVKFAIYHSTKDEKPVGEAITTLTTNDKGIITFKGAKDEWYYIKEISTVENYKIVSKPKTIKLTKAGTTVEFENEEKTGLELTIEKQDATGKKLSGAQFIIYRYVQDNSGSWYLKDPDYKKYPDDKYTQKEVEAKSTTTKYRRQYLYKPERNGEVAYDTEHTYNDIKDNAKYRFKTDFGTIELSDLKVGGDYFAKEVKAPNGYKELEYPVRLGKCPTSKKITKKITNTPEGTGACITIVKENERGTRLSGAVFVIYKEGTGGTEEYLKRDHTYVKTNYNNVYDDLDYRYTTNGEGKIELSDLEPGTYYAREVVAPSGYQKIDDPIKLGTKTETGQEPIEKTINNKPIFENPGGDLKVIKQDMDTGERLAGVTIRVTGPDGYDQTTITNASGEAYFGDLKPGNYLVEELSNPMYGYTVMVNQLVTVNGVEEPPEGEEATEVQPEQVVVELYNPKQTGNLRIRKIDPDSGRALEGVSFKVRLSNGNYLVAIDNNGNSQTRVVGSVLLSDMGETNDESSATEFVTDSRGYTEIHNILVGNYQVIETSIGDHPAYELDDNYIFWASNSGSGTGRVANVRVDRQLSFCTRDTTNANVSEVTVKNRRKYINLSGYVWQDIAEIGKDVEGGNGLYHDSDNDSRDRLLEGIPVQLKDKNGTVAQLKDKNGNIYSAEKTTDSKGAYKFERVEIDKLPEYYIEFTYNGMSYRSVIPTLDMNIKNGSRAIEGKNRPEFNSRYETITYGNSNAHQLQYDYDSENRVSTLIYGDESAYNYGYSDNPGPPVSGVAEQYNIKADTYQAYNDYIGGSNGIMTPEYARKNEVDEIENINLGMEAREHIDLSLVKDLNTIKVTINHATHVYQYGDRYKPSLWKEDPYNMSPRVKFESEYGTASYTRALYASDVYADDSKTDDTLRVKATYKIGIKNGSANLKTIINEIEDYYDSKYLDGINNVKAGTQVNEQGDIVGGTELGIEFVNSGSSDYYKMRLKGSVEVKDQKDSFVYVQLEVKPENIIDILGNQNKLFNIAEITSYSTKKGDDIYASIDKDSQPGNLIINDQTTWEDDTDKAPGLQLVLQEERKMDGKVFIDTTTGELKTAEVRQGDGEYKDGEPVVKDVQVELLNLNKNRRTSR